MKKILALLLALLLPASVAAAQELHYIGDIEAGTAFGFEVPEGWVRASAEEEDGTEMQYYYATAPGEVDEGYLYVMLSDTQTGFDGSAEMAKLFFTAMLMDWGALDTVDMATDFFETDELFGVFFEKEWLHEGNAYARNGLLVLNGDWLLAVQLLSRTLPEAEHWALFEGIIETLTSPAQMQAYAMELAE